MKKIFSILLSVVIMLSIVGLWPTIAAGDELISAPGQYSGYSSILYDEWKLNSQYVEVRDGTKIAIDIFRPAVNGDAVNTPYPVLWVYNWGGRAKYTGVPGGLPIIRRGDDYTDLTKYGYVIAVVDARGTGASYGQMIGSYSRTEAQDTFDITEWLAVQPWCDGNVGMFGCSHMGQIEFLAAGMKPPHLKAIFPQCYSFNYYFGKVQGGISGSFRPSNTYESDKLSVPVDEDLSGTMLAEAVEQHKNNPTDADVFGALPFEDSYSLITDSRMWIEASPGTYTADIESSGIPIYQWGNWNDFMTKVMRDAFIFSANLDNVHKTSIGSLGHCQFGSFNLLAELRRWFDYWLKDIDNGIMNEPQFYYCTTYFNPGSTTPIVDEWRFAWQWPLPNKKDLTYYMAAGPSGSMNTGVNDGSLTTTAPTSAIGQDDYIVDYSITRTNRDEKGLTYTTSALTSDVELTGYPQVHLWVSSTDTDGDFFAFLEDVDATGAASVIQQLQLRASHRTLGIPPFDNLEQPWHRHYEEDIILLTPGELVELVPETLPLSYIVKAGHHIRLTITCAYPGSSFLESSPAPTISVYRNDNNASYITLPIVADSIDTDVQIEPATLNLNSRGQFTARISFPENLAQGYIDDVDLSTVMCNGAYAVSGKVANRTLVVKFNREDLSVSPGEEVALTIIGEFGDKYYYGPLTFEGSDTIKVMVKGKP